MAQAPLLDMQDIDISFGGVAALKRARLTVTAGEVHALIGQNGAGKSTLIKILTGAYRKSAGTIRFDGREADFRTPKEAREAGISTIYQEINLVPFRSVAENIFLGREPRRFGLIDWKTVQRRADETARIVRTEDRCEEARARIFHSDSADGRARTRGVVGCEDGHHGRVDLVAR